MSMREITALDRFLTDYKNYSHQPTFVKMFDVKELKELLKDYAGFNLKTFNYRNSLIIDKEIYEAIKKARLEAEMSYIKALYYFESKKLEKPLKVYDKPKLIPA